MKRLGYLSAAPRVSTHPDAEAGGPRSHVLGVINAFRNIGWEVHPYIVGDRISQKIMRGSEKAISKNRIRALLADIVRLGMGFFNSIYASKELSGKVDWVYERFATLQSLGIVFKRKGIPWILETNGPFFYEAKTERKSIFFSGLARKLEIRAYRECDVLVCISEKLKEIIVQESGVEEEKVLVVPNGVDTNFFNPVMYKPKRLYSGFTIGFVGSLIEWQGLELLLQAIYELICEGTEINLTVVGDGPMRLKLENQAKKLGIDSNVTFCGRVSRNDIPSYIAGFDIGFSGQVNLKQKEMYHSPLKLYEYMAMGKPVIASDYDDARNLIKGKNTGFLFTAGDLKDLKRAIKEAYLCKELAHMGMMARKIIVENHSWDARVQEMIPKIEAILRGKK